MINKLEKLINDYNLNENNNINSIIQNDELIFNYSDINEIKSLNNFHKQLSDIFNKTSIKLKNKINFISSIKNKMINQNEIDNGVSTYKDLFREIESIIAFFDINFKNSSALLLPYNLDYHYDKLLFSYLFSCFDKIARIIYFHISEENYNENKIGDIKFNKIDTYIKNDISNDFIEIKNFIENIIKLQSYKYIKQTRNNIEHHYTNPYLKCNFNCDTMICAILIFELILKIHKILNK